MTFLQGKSVSYTRFLADGPDFRKGLDETLGNAFFASIQDESHVLERVGTCSWRNLLDGPVDRGYLDGDPDLYACGLRHDVKRAPSQLAKAETARAVADYLQTCGGKADRKRIKEIGEKIRLELAKSSHPQPSHGIMLANAHTGLVLVDGPTGGGTFVVGLLGLRPLYLEAPDKFLEWLVWAGTNEALSEVANVWPEHEITFRDKEGDGSSHKGRFSMAAALSSALLKGQWVDRSRFSLVLEDHTAQLTICRGGMKISNLVFPEVVGRVGTLEARLADRAKFVMAVEAELSRLVVDFAARLSANSFPEEFTSLWPAAVEEEVARG